MKTLILFILISITSTSSQKEAVTITIHQNGQAAIKECQLPATAQPVEAAKFNDNMEMPNNWNVKVIEW